MKALLLAAGFVAGWVAHWGAEELTRPLGEPYGGADHLEGKHKQAHPWGGRRSDALRWDEDEIPNVLRRQ